MTRWSELFDLLTRIPWPISGTLAALTYPVARLITNHVEGQTLIQAFVVGIAGVWWFFTAIFFAAAVFSFVRGIPARRPPRGKGAKDGKEEGGGDKV